MRLACADDIFRLLGPHRAVGITILPGIEWPGERYDESLAHTSDDLAWRAQHAASAGLRFSLEPHVGSIVPTPEQAKRLCEQTPGFELTVDYCHFVGHGLPEEQFDVLAPHARHVYVRGAAPGRIQTSVAERTFDVERMVGALHKAGYDGYLALEYVWLRWERCNECDNLAETIILRDRLLAAVAGESWSYPEV